MTICAVFHAASSLWISLFFSSDSQGILGESNHIMQFELETLLDLYSQLDSRIDETERLIVELIKDIDPPLLSIKGVGEITAAVIYAEYGDISNFFSG
jgi:transposase